MILYSFLQTDPIFCHQTNNNELYAACLLDDSSRICVYRGGGNTMIHSVLLLYYSTALIRFSIRATTISGENSLYSSKEALSFIAFESKSFNICLNVEYIESTL